MAWQNISPEVFGKSFLRSAAHSNQWMGLTICCGMAVKKMCMLGVTVRIETVT